MAYIKLNKSNFFNNLDIIAKQTKAVDKIALVLKDNAYGHGLLEVAQMASEYGIAEAVVRSEEEARAISKLFRCILILADLPKRAEANFVYTINDLECIAKMPRGVSVELKVDSGMHRNGVSAGEIEKAFELIDDADLDLVGVFTHHRCADELSSEWFWQEKNFSLVVEKARRLSRSKLRFHSSNSAALFRHSDFNGDLARVGIAAYGCLEMPEALKVSGLKPVLSLWASKNSSRHLLSGSRVGYGGEGEVSSNKGEVVSNYDFGYADGFFRSNAKSEFRSACGAKLVGRISMDNSSFETDDEEICVFDDASKVAKNAKSISYEILTALKPHLKRVVV